MTGSQQLRLPPVESLSAGLEMALAECRRQFRWERWSCPEQAFTISSRDFGKAATREMAFVHAIVGAGLMHAVTRDCSDSISKNESEQLLPERRPTDDDDDDDEGPFKCSCDLSMRGHVGGPKVGWSWGGCSDNIQVGERSTEDFLEGHEKGDDLTAKINLHNNRIGMLAVRKQVKRKCKCHGVSGTCTFETCAMKLGSFKEVGDHLKQAYDNSLHLEARRPLGGHLPDTLVFLQESPDYCHRRENLGVEGTLGRQCLRKNTHVEASDKDKTSCRTLCRHCGHRVKKTKVWVSDFCNCRFNWCCKVQCMICSNLTVTLECE